MSNFILGILIRIANFRSEFSIFDRYSGLPIEKPEFRLEFWISDRNFGFSIRNPECQLEKRNFDRKLAIPIGILGIKSDMQYIFQAFFDFQSFFIPFYLNLMTCKFINPKQMLKIAE